ncbi:MAG: DNA replication protein [Rhodospirillaceae bacterium]|nr:DNA replication protein [Rhodospirillaceae bacterium]
MTGEARQLPLALRHAPALGREDFLAGGSNAAALAWIDRWPDWPGRALAIHGPAGSGKTHLGGIWAAGAGAVAVGLGELGQREAPQLLGDAPACLIDTGEWQGETPLAEVALLHLANWLAQGGAGLLICSRLAPARWPVALPDLRSRLAAITAVAIAAPDDALLGALLAKLFADRRLRVTPEVIEHLVRRMERSCAAAGRLVEAIDAASLAARRPVTVPLVRAVLERPGQGEGDGDVTVE